MTSESIRRGQQGLPLLQDPALPVYCMISTLVAHGTETEPQEATEREPDLSAGRIQIKGLHLYLSRSGKPYQEVDMQAL